MNRLNCSEITPDLSIADLLTCWSELVPVLIRRGMACPGCPLAAFETLGSAACVYQLDPGTLVDELRQALVAMRGRGTEGETGNEPIPGGDR